MISIQRAGNLWEIRFTHPDREAFALIVDAMKEVGATWDKPSLCWVLAEKKKADILARCDAFSKTAAQFLSCVKASSMELLGLPTLDGPRQPSIPGLALMDHQVDGVDFIAAREGSLIAWEVGTGKTPLAIACINAAEEDGVPALVICPAHLKYNWYKEFRGDPEEGKVGWLVDPTLTVGIASGSYFPPTDIVIINYDILPRHKAKLDSIAWKFAFVDESQMAKSPKAQRTKCIIGGVKGKGKNRHKWSPLHAKRRVALTATPILNKPQDVWAICNWLDPKRWPSLYWFQQKFCQVVTRDQWMKKRMPDGSMRPIKRRIKEILPPSKAQMDELNRRLRGTVMSRIRSVDVLKDLPPISRRVIEVDVGGTSSSVREEKKLLKVFRPKIAALQAAIEIAKIEGSEEGYAKAVKALTDYYKKEEGHIAVLRQRIAIAKVPYVVDHIRSLLDEGKRILLFAHHKVVIRALYQALDSIVPGAVVHFYGDSTPEEKRDAERRIQLESNAEGAAQVFIGGITAAGTGLTLTGASHVVFAEEDWVPSNIRQCEGRAWRKGQTLPVQVDHVVARGSLDAHIAKRTVAKQEIANQAIDGGLDLEEPVDWIGDHRSMPTPDAPMKLSGNQVAAYQYGLHRLVSQPKRYKISDAHLMIASRLQGRHLEGRAAQWARFLAIRYLGENPDSKGTRLPKTLW